MLADDEGGVLTRKIGEYTECLGVSQGINEETLELLAPYLEAVTHSEVRSTLGMHESLWTWVNALAVLAGSDLGKLRSESRSPKASSETTPTHSGHTSPAPPASRDRAEIYRAEQILPIHNINRFICAARRRLLHIAMTDDVTYDDG